MTTTAGAARAIADVTEGTILASVDILVPPERVFDALTDPREVPRWWGAPGVYTTDKWTADFRVGGRWRADGTGANGKPFYVEGEFIEIDRPWRVVQTWEPSWDPGSRTTITYQLLAIEGGTRLIVRHVGFKGRHETCQGHADGWVRVIGWLTDFLQPKPATTSDASLYYLVRLLSPRTDFMENLAPDERQMMREHGAYWAGKQAEGKMLIYGPVADPKGGWGVGVMMVASEAEMLELQKNDPAILGNRGLYYENLPMLRAIYRSL